MERRTFIKTTTAAAVSSLLVQPALASKSVKVGGFSKHLQWLNYNDTSDMVAEIGWDGIECPVRKGGHVLPERVADDLPKMVEALKKNNLEMLMATTNIKDVKDPVYANLLKILAQEKVSIYRIGGWKYSKEKSVPETLNEIKQQLKEMVAINKELGLTAAYQNHSGTGVGAAVWDVYDLIKDFDTNVIGSAFDIGHATVEGGYAWVNHFKLMAPFIKIVIVKDFYWAKNNKGVWKANWCPLGEGMVNKKFFAMLKASGFNGSIIQHFEYPVDGKTEKEKQQNSIKAMKKDCATLKSWLNEAGF